MNEEQGIKRLLNDLDEAPDDAARVEIMRASMHKLQAMQYLAFEEANRLAKERRRLYLARTVYGWAAVVLCANYAAAAVVVREVPDVLFNVVIALIWAFVAVVNFKTA